MLTGPGPPAPITPACCARCTKPASRSISSPAAASAGVGALFAADRRRRRGCGTRRHLAGPAASERFYGWRPPLRVAGLRRWSSRRRSSLSRWSSCSALAVVAGDLGAAADAGRPRRRAARLTSALRRWLERCSRRPCCRPSCRGWPAVAASSRWSCCSSPALLRPSARAAPTGVGRGAAWWRLLRRAARRREPGRHAASTELWNLVRGAAPIAAPRRPRSGRRYVELLAENLGQPGFRELLAGVHDIDARRDLVFALLGGRARAAVSSAAPAPAMRRDARSVETFDLAGAARDHAGRRAGGGAGRCRSPPTAPAPLPPEGPWRGETHRLCDRPGGLCRLLEECGRRRRTGDPRRRRPPPPARAARAERRPRRPARPRRRAARRLRGGRAPRRASNSSPAASPACSSSGRRTIPLGPLDFGGVYDERSDRRHTLAELIDRGYEDAYRQFIEPVVGGERRAASKRSNA